VTIEVKGLKEDLKYLNGINPKLRREIGREFKKLGQPVVDAIESSRPKDEPKGFRHNGRTGFGKSKKVIVKTDTRKARKRNLNVGQSFESVGVIKIMSRDAALAIIEMAGKRNNVKMSGQSRSYAGRPQGHSLNGQGMVMIRKLNNSFGRAARVMWPASEKTADQKLLAEFQKLVNRVRDEVNRELIGQGVVGEDLAKLMRKKYL